jgi:hypothetical protein
MSKKIIVRIAMLNNPDTYVEDQRRVLEEMDELMMDLRRVRYLMERNYKLEDIAIALDLSEDEVIHLMHLLDDSDDEETE